MSAATIEQTDALATLGNVYNNLVLVGGVQKLRDLGFTVRIVHHRFSPAARERTEANIAMEREDLRRQGIKDPKVLKDHAHHIRTNLLLPMWELRARFEASGDLNYVDSHGGRTEVTLIPPDEEKEFKAEIECHTSDPYIRRKGVLMGLASIFRDMCTHYNTPKREVVDFVTECREGVASSTISGTGCVLAELDRD